MIKYTEHKDIDKKKWDLCIQESLNSNTFVYSWYLDLACENWSALILNDYEAVLPIPEKSKYSISYLLQPVFLFFLEIYSKKNISKELEDSFWNTLPKKIKLIDIYYSPVSFSNNTYGIKKRTYQVLNINKSYNDIYHSYGSSVIKNLRKAEKAQLSIAHDISAKEIVTFYKNNVGGKISTFKEAEYKLLEKLMNQCIEKNHGISIGVIDSNKKIVASSFIIKSKNELYFFKGSACNEGKKMGAMHYLLDFIFKNYSEQNLQFNFAGSSIENIANFNKSFGAQDLVYLHLTKNTLPKLIRWLKN